MENQQKRKPFRRVLIQIVVWAILFWVFSGLILPYIENTEITLKSLEVKVPVSIIFGGVLAFLEKYFNMI